jgi:hypothetical protein
MLMLINVRQMTAGRPITWVMAKCEQRRPHVRRPICQPTHRTPERCGDSACDCGRRGSRTDGVAIESLTRRNS